MDEASPALWIASLSSCGGRAAGMPCCTILPPFGASFLSCLLFPNRTSLCTEMAAMLRSRECRCRTELLAASSQKPQLLRGRQQRSLKTPAATARCGSRWPRWQRRTAAPRGTALIPQSSYRSGWSGESWMRTATWRRCETNPKQVTVCLSREVPHGCVLYCSTSAAFHRKWLHQLSQQDWNILTWLKFLCRGIPFSLLNILLKKAGCAIMSGLVFPPSVLMLEGNKREEWQRQNKNQKPATPPSYPRTNICAFPKNLSLSSHGLHFALFIDLLYRHSIVVGKCQVEHITEPTRIVGISHPREV